MRKTFLFICVLFLACSIQAQDIFKEHGFEKKTLTLSMGKYEEVFTNREVIQIGTVLLNTKTNKVIEFLDEETEEASFKAEHSSRWLTPDPLARKYPEISPYAFCLNNPVNAIDPDGREVIFIIRTRSGVDHYKYTADGNLKLGNTTYLASGVRGHAGQILNGLNRMMNSGDDNYVNQVTTLTNSDKVHMIDATGESRSGVIPGSGDSGVPEAKAQARKGEGIGTTTTFKFSESELSNGVEKTPYTTITHEIQHIFDFDQGNMQDYYDKDGNPIKGQNNPAEQRAMKNEDTAREQERLNQRRTY